MRASRTANHHDIPSALRIATTVAGALFSLGMFMVVIPVQPHQAGNGARASANR